MEKRKENGAMRVTCIKGSNSAMLSFSVDALQVTPRVVIGGEAFDSGSLTKNCRIEITRRRRRGEWATKTNRV